MSVPNQKIIKICKANYNGKPYVSTNLDAVHKAMIELKGEAFKVWFYLSKNKNNFEFELSRKDAEAWGIKKDSYYRGIEQLEEKDYVCQSRANSNIYIFSESGQASSYVETEVEDVKTEPDASPLTTEPVENCNIKDYVKFVF